MLQMGLPANAADVVPSDTTKFGGSVIFVGGAGTVVVEPEGTPGTYVSFTMPAGSYVLLRCTQVRAASGATLMRRLW